LPALLVLLFGRGTPGAILMVLRCHPLTVTTWRTKSYCPITTSPESDPRPPNRSPHRASCAIGTTGVSWEPLSRFSGCRSPSDSNFIFATFCRGISVEILRFVNTITFIEAAITARARYQRNRLFWGGASPRSAPIFSGLKL